LINTIKADYKWNGELQKRTSTDYQIVHHAKAIKCTVDDIHKWHQDRGFLGIGYNWFIRKDGTEYEGRPEWASDADAFGYNNNSLSICLEGDFTKESLGRIQREALIKRMLENKIKYPKIISYRHSDVNDTDCPAFDGWADILGEVDIRYAEHLKSLKTENESLEMLNKKVADLEKKIERIVEHFDRKINHLDSRIK